MGNVEAEAVSPGEDTHFSEIGNLWLLEPCPVRWLSDPRHGVSVSSAGSQGEVLGRGQPQAGLRAGTGVAHNALLPHLLLSTNMSLLAMLTRLEARVLGSCSFTLA